jgi:hypothetical protein
MGECIQAGPLERGSFNPRMSCKYLLHREIKGCNELYNLMTYMYVHLLLVLILSN